MKEVSTPFFESTYSKTIKPGHTHIVGFEFDGTACFRKGAATGPNHIRKLSDGIESYSPYLDSDLTDIDIIDLGNLPCEGEEGQQLAYNHFDSMTKMLNFADDKIKFLGLGGEHSISYPFIRAALKNYPDLILLHLDAHADLRDGYEGHHFSHASIIRRVLDNFEKAHRLIQYGIRSGTRDEYLWMQKNTTLRTDLALLLTELSQLSNDRPIYLTLDLDFFDPAYLPGTGTPEAGGEDFHSFVKLIKVLKDKNVVGADVVELAPPIDPTENSTVFACKVIRELLLVMSSR